MRPALALALWLAASAAAAEPWRRFAVIVGNDEGGESTRPLLYAREDARKIRDVLVRLGGVRDGDARLVLNGTASDFLSALSAAERSAADASRAGEHTALIVYFSGHAKDGALRLGDTQMPFESLKARLAESPVDIKIGIFDSCRSGALTRTKGARRAPEFAIESGTARSARGLVILTSSASDEDSQESDQLHGSYFSHHLASGLLGDADRSGDGRVTLSEAYAYAYDRTVADTADSAAGAQHPTFSYDLAGNGDWVLTDVGTHSEGLLFPANAPGGVYFLVDHRGFVVAEIDKQPDAERRIAVPAGAYRLTRRLVDHLRLGDVEVTGGQLFIVDEAKLKDAPFSDDPVKGVSRSGTTLELGLSGGYQSFFDSQTRQDLFPATGLIEAELTLRDFFRRDWLWSFELASGAANGVALPDQLNASYHFNELSVGSSITVEWPNGPWAPFAGAQLALLLMTRNFTNLVAPAQLFATWSPGLVGGIRYRLSHRWSLEAKVRVHYVLYNVDENRSLGYAEAGAQVVYDF